MGALRFLMLAFFLVMATTAAAPDLAADLSVVGVVVGAPAERRAALLRSHGQTRVVGVGDSAFGGKVAAIGQEAVTLDFDGSSVEVRVRGAKGPAATAVAPAPAKRGDPAALSMSRDEVQRRIASEAPRILAETAIMPATTDGHVTGMTISRLPAGASILSDAGLLPGDVLTQINGTPVDGLPALMGLWTRLQGETSIQAVVLRNGQPVSLNVNLR
jgi:type II secretion system protein C